jgi:ubiquinol-cytochrome c reductase cytochrome c subunit
MSSPNRAEAKVIMRRANLFLFAALALGIAAPSAASAASAPAEVARLKAVYVKSGCWSCHGYEGQGGSTGPKISPPQAYAAFSAFVRNTTGAMPPFTAAVLPEQDLRDLHAYLQAIPAGPNPATIPILQ